MKTSSTLSFIVLWKYGLYLLLTLAMTQRSLPVQAQATISTPMGMGKDCGGNSNSYRVFDYNTTTQTLTNLNVCTPPSLKDPTTGATFQPLSGSTTFDPVNQMLYYIETTTDNNSIIWNWTPGTCPTGNLAPVYTFPSDFIVGLEFNTVTGIGYQVEFSTGAAPYTVSLRQITSFSPPVFGSSVPITFPSGVTINSSNSDYIITPTGKMYLVIDNKIFSLDYSTYGSGVLNAVYLGAMTFSNGAYMVGLAYADGKLVGSITNNGSTCSYEQIDLSSGTPVLTAVTAPVGTNTSRIFSSTDMATLITGVGAAKRVSSVTTTGLSQYKVQYDVKVRNFGNVDLTNVQTVDNVSAVFGTAFVSASIAAVGSLPSGVTLNPAYNGSTNTNLFAAGSTMIASPPDSVIVRITVLLNNPNVNFVYNNSAIASATGTLFSKNVSDSSNNSPVLEPDPNGNAVPDDAGEGVPTPLLLSTYTLLSNILVDFNGQGGATANNLHWALQNTSAGVSVLVQRSTDGVNFETQTQMLTGENSNQTYQWTDTRPVIGNNYYRLQITVMEGSSFYSDIITIRNTDPNTKLSVTPNPFHQSVSFSLSLNEADRISYRILDFASHTIQSGQVAGQAGQNTIVINGLGQVTSGMYILEVQAGTNRYFKKLVKIQ